MLWMIILITITLSFVLCRRVFDPREERKISPKGGRMFT